MSISTSNENKDEMYVTKRNGKSEIVSFDKILNRIKKLGEEVGIKINYTSLTMKIIDQLYDKISTAKIDELTSEQCAIMASIHPDYNVLAVRIVVSNHQKNTKDSFSETMRLLYNFKDKNGKQSPLVSEELFNVVKKNSAFFNKLCDYSRDYLIDYFGFKTLERAYLSKINNKTVERPQHMWLRVSIGLHGDNLEKIKDTYDAMSLKYFTHATPTLFNSGTPHPQLSSCFVAGTPVFTVSRGPVAIENVEIGDTVVTHTGLVKPVVQTHKNLLNNRTLFEVKVYKTPTINVTDNHRFWSITKEQLEWGEKPQWNSIDKLRIGDWISIPKKINISPENYEILDLYEVLKDVTTFENATYTYEFEGTLMRRNTFFKSDYRPAGMNKKGEWFERYITIDENFAWFLGSWYGDGCILFGKNSKSIQTHCGIAFAQNPNNQTFVSEIIRIGEKYLGVYASVYNSKTQNCLSITFNNSAVGNAFNILFGKLSSEKFLNRRIYSWNRQMISAFLGGLVSTDGCITLSGSIVLQLSNQPLMNSIFQVTRSVGFDTSLTLMSKPYKDRHTYIGRMTIPWVPEIMAWVKKHYDDERLIKNERVNTSIEIDNHIFLRINVKRKITENLPEYVYTLGVKDDHSYVVQGLVAENCFLLAMENDSISGIYNTLKDCAMISKWAGGIGLHIHNIRASGSHIRGTNGQSNGIVPMLKVFNNTAKYVDQCVHPQTLIYTKDGPMKICNTKPQSTQIINRSGNFETIEKVLEHSYSGPIIEIFTHFKSLLITPEHPVYVLTNYINETEEIINKDLDLGLAKFEWFDAKNVSKDEYLVYSIPNYVKDFPELTEEICYIYGLIFSGIVNNFNNNEYMNGYDPLYQIESFETYEIEHYSFELDMIKDFLNKYNIKYEFFIKESMNKLKFNKSVNLPFVHSDFYENSKNKIGERWLFLPPNKIQKILDGLGFFHYDDFDDSIFFMNLRLGLIYNSYKPDRKIISKRYKNFLLVPVQNIKTSTYSGVLYDLQMTNEHNYMLETGIVHNGGGRRNGSFAIYLEPWHADIELFLQMRKNHGDEELKARDLFYAIWMCDLLMKRIKAGEKWTLMCPDECPGLSDVYGDEFEALYTKYESEGKGRKSVNARELWFQILDAQMETGTPYLVYKDATNKKSNQKNVGIIKSSNLCSEITLYSDSNETAVCNLASIALPSFIDKSDPESPKLDYEKLHQMTRLITYNLNQVIDRNFYPTEKTRVSNMRHRPIGIGVQGLADAFIQLDIAFHSEEAKQINKNIFETIYHAALEESVELAVRDGPYETFQGSPASQGILQFDLWDVDPGQERYDWNKLKREIQEKGLRNSMLLSPMPTASTSQILGFNECIEPITSNIYSRRTIAGEFIVANKYLMNDLIKLDLWNEKIKNNIIANHGSIQHIDIIPQNIKDKYKTVWEIPMKHLIDMAAERGAFVCQSQSLNLWLEDPNYNNLTSMHFYAWNKGLKTGIYYLRRRGRHQAQQFTIEPERRETTGEIQQEDEICEACSA